MCGITGFWGGSAVDEGIAERMAARIASRGPDDTGAWIDEQAGVALAHRRLSVLDLSPAGHQPMRSRCARYTLVYNGEIYNHLELREALDRRDAALPGMTAREDCHAPAGLAMTGRGWRGHSDTETLLAGFEHWGVEATLQRAVGMFALALWDRAERRLYLARDRLGEKPLYYGWAGGAFVFGSELKALRAYPGFANPVSREALRQYFRFLYVPAPLSIYEGVYKLPPGCLLTLTSEGLERGADFGSAPLSGFGGGVESPGRETGGISLRPYWSLKDAVATGAEARITDEGEALDALEGALREAVRLQSLADVPLGAFLSGGVDSSTIVALMQQQASRPVQTFTVGFEEAGFDESAHARAVARHLGTDHSELFVTAAEARAVIPRLPEMYDEPFADASQIPTHLVCRAARQQVTVALSGDAGDELFGGYNRYFWGPRIWNRVGRLPYAVRQAMAAALQFGAPSTWDRLLGRAGVVRPGEKLHKLGRALRGARSLDDLYWNLVSEWEDPAGLVVEGSGAIPNQSANTIPNLHPVERMMFHDAMTYLPDDILCKVDRAAMSVSLETRVPFLDHRVVELAWRLPLSMKVRGNEGKWALRQILYRHVPRELIERPKAGFALPLGQWLRGPLREWAEELLDAGRLQREGYLRPGPIRAAWREHLSGRYDRTPRLWSVLMFQSWLEANS